MDDVVSARPRWWSFAVERPNFRRLWCAQSVSVFGSQVSLIAFPLIAISLLDASVSEVGMLASLERAPFLLFGLIAGVLVDRWRPRLVLLITDWIRAAVLGLIPAAAFFDVLSIEWLFVITFAVGSCTVFFDIAYQSVLTSVVESGDLLMANRWLETSRSVAEMSGPGVAAGLLRVVSVPVSIAVDALSFAFSALFVHSIRPAGPVSSAPRDPSTRDASIWSEFKAGLRYIRETSFLRWNAAIGASWNLLYQALLAVFFVYLARDLDLSATTIAIVVLAGSFGAVLGVLAMGRINKWCGLGWGIVLSMCMTSAGGILLATADGSSLPAIAIVGFGFLLINASQPIFNVNVISIRQMITPDHLMGRTTAAIRFLVWGALPIGALIGGFLGEAFGTRPTIVVIGAGFLIPAVMTLISPIRRIRDISDVGIKKSEPTTSKEG
ncbi:MFS transporter [Streptomyces chattanoogensis]|uniref:Major facilitator transporter n=1 Tax=Streptomyces chattanoogensis TaxID=66876 RepID=A0A0N0XTZ1_9ACTN|nr:MFS transporter [Streptomyces chattanoogensis]KPC61626.1 major facilitator transporter [Streptomyces chattanoogensis]